MNIFRKVLGANPVRDFSLADGTISGLGVQGFRV